MTRGRRGVIAALGTAATLAFASPPGGGAAARPNIIFILADDLGYGHLGSYGQTRIRTPRLDRMAAEGMRFTQAYAASTVCAPSRASLMTGLHQGHATIRGNSPKLPLRPEDVTVAEVLKVAGYATAGIGKWALGDAGTTGAATRQGFDSWYGYLNQTHAHDYYTDHLFRDEERVPVPKGAYTHDLFAEEALVFVRRQAGRPFFLYLAYTIPHANNEKTPQGMEVPSDAPYTAESWPQQEKNLAAMITRMDSDIGRLLDLLAARGLDRDTIVFFTSDNGPHKEGGSDPKVLGGGGALRGIKRDLYEGGIRVPLIVRWPGRVPASVSDQVIASWDVLPTLAEIAGVAVPAGLDGRSMRRPLQGAAAARREDVLYWEFHEGGFAQAARWGDWKAVRTGQGRPLELYDVRRDLSETTDLAAREPAVVSRMEALLAGARTPSPHWPVPPGNR
jgi:arylsulfatase A-like enzyme